MIAVAAISEADAEETGNLTQDSIVLSDKAIVGTLAERGVGDGLEDICSSYQTHQASLWITISQSPLQSLFLNVSSPLFMILFPILGFSFDKIVVG